MDMPKPQEGIEQMLANKLTTKIEEHTPPDKRKQICKERVAYLIDKVKAPSNNPLMLLTEEKELLPIYEAYVHIEKDGTIVFVGEGLMGRHGDATSRRTPTGEHPTWMIEQLFAGNEYIEIKAQFLTKNSAKEYAQYLIKKHNPRFNVNKG